MSNHPVHILNDEGNYSPSSFIPFCSFGGQFIGSRVNSFDIPVCNIFKLRMHNDQFCYETDLAELKSSDDEILEEQLEMGLTLVLDYNEERQLGDNAKNILHYHATSVSIHLDTISM